MEINLAQYNLVRPEKLRWFFPANLPSVLDGVQSKSLRSFFNTIDETLLKNNITWSCEKVDFDTYLAWLPYYETNMKENNFNIIATPEWYQDRTAKGFTINALIFRQNDKIVASGIIIDKDATETHLSFKASDRLDLTGKSNSSIGSVVDYFFLKRALAQKFSVISSGRSRNAFGLYNNLGYLDFKLKIGYEPKPAEDTPLLEAVPLNDEQKIMFFGLRDGQQVLASISHETTNAWYINIVTQKKFVVEDIVLD